MSTFLWVCAALALLIHLYRQYWTYRKLPQVQTDFFDGKIYRVGEITIAHRVARSKPQKTIICFPGFLEDMRYFQSLYEDVECELILVNNANYHCPYPLENAQTLLWPDNPYRVGTIEYDGFYLAQVVEQLASGEELIVHGHSRGGAVALEAGRQAPALMKAKKVSAILEAPVLPGARTAGNGSEPIPHHLTCYLLPMVLGSMRNDSQEKLLKQRMMHPTNSHKTEVCGSIATNTSSYKTSVVNAKNIRSWQAAHTAELYRNYDRIVVVMGERDDVLDNASMLASAEGGQKLNDAVSIVRTENTNHFPTLEQPDTMLRLVGEQARDQIGEQVAE